MVGTRIFLSLEVAGLPNVRLPATAVRHSEDRLGEYAALRFDVPKTSTQGLGLLLASQLSASERKPSVLIVDRSARTRSRVADALQQGGFEVLTVENATDALKTVRHEAVDVVLARCDGSGCAALLAVAQDSPTTLRVAFGRHEQVTQAMALGHAQAPTSDPSSASEIHALLAQRLATSKNPV
jgi:CheY-like chemotaxis protein